MPRFYIVTNIFGCPFVPIYHGVMLYSIKYIQINKQLKEKKIELNFQHFPRSTITIIFYKKSLLEFRGVPKFLTELYTNNSLIKTGSKYIEERDFHRLIWLLNRVAVESLKLLYLYLLYLYGYQ